jgi:DNA replication protein DnaC
MNSISDAIDRTSLGHIPEDLGFLEKQCGKHGPYQSKGSRLVRFKREWWSPCPQCESERLEAQRVADAERKAYERQVRMELVLGKAAIPARFLNRTLENYMAINAAQKHALHASREYLAKFPVHARSGRGLVFAGRPGTGKSHLAVAILRKVIETHAGVYTTCSDFIRAIRSTWHREAERTEAQVLNDYASIPLLVLDEIGVAFGTAGEEKHLFDLLDRRYRELLPTIILTNEDADGLRKFVGDRVFDRLRETSDWVPFTWDSYRSIAGKEVLHA